MANMTLDQRLEVMENKNVLDKDLEAENDQIAFDRFNEMKLVNIKSTMEKSPNQRSKKEVDTYVCTCANTLISLWMLKKMTSNS